MSTNVRGLLKQTQSRVTTLQRHNSHIFLMWPTRKTQPSQRFNMHELRLSHCNTPSLFKPFHVYSKGWMKELQAKDDGRQHRQGRDGH